MSEKKNSLVVNALAQLVNSLVVEDKDWDVIHDTLIIMKEKPYLQACVLQSLMTKLNYPQYFDFLEKEKSIIENYDEIHNYALEYYYNKNQESRDNIFSGSKIICEVSVEHIDALSEYCFQTINFWGEMSAKRCAVFARSQIRGNLKDYMGKDYSKVNMLGQDKYPHIIEFLEKKELNKDHLEIFKEELFKGTISK